MSNFWDRRHGTRMDVVGVLHGTLDIVEAARIVNLSRTGALIEAAAALVVGSTQFIQCVSGDQVINIEVRVRHCREERATAEESIWLVGVDFVSPSDDVLRRLGMPMHDSDSQAE